MGRRSYILGSKVVTKDYMNEVGEPIDSSSQLDLSVESEIDAVGADVSKVNQEIADLIDSIHNENTRSNARTTASRRTCRGSSMRLVSERQSDPVAVRGTRLAEKGSAPNVHVSCRVGRHADEDDQAARLEEEMDELREIFAKV